MNAQEPEARGGTAEELIVAGVGASAGGLEALTDLLQHLPPELRMAVVLVQHLDAHHERALVELLAAKTEMSVVTAQQDMRLEAGHVYVIAPNSVLRVRGGRLQLEPRNLHPSRALA